MSRKTGVWLIGACGSVSTCVVAGVEAIKAGLVSRTGLVTDLAEFAALPLAGLEDLVFGGYDIRSTDLAAAAREVNAGTGILPERLQEAIRPALNEVSRRISNGCSINCGEAIGKLRADGPVESPQSVTAVIAKVQSDLRAFQQAHGLADVVMVNLASTEPYLAPPAEWRTLASLRALIAADRRDLLTPSVIYAYAAIDAGFPYINFTPSPGSSVPALGELALERRVPHYGKDGKTGETLVKTTLAPMFVMRNLRILSWAGHNILGNRDGEVLAHPQNREAKIRDKDETLRKLVRDPDVFSQVRIDYVPSLGDWKTAWDFIHFQGFLDTRMIMQFIWQGCDSALAAPLVIDMIRLAEYAHRRGEFGAMKHLASFFKCPLDEDDHDFHRQFERLVRYAEECVRADTPRREKVEQ